MILVKILGKNAIERWLKLEKFRENQTYTLEIFFQYVGKERVELYDGVPNFMSPASYEHEGVC